MGGPCYTWSQSVILLCRYAGVFSPRFDQAFLSRPCDLAYRQGDLMDRRSSAGAQRLGRVLEAFGPLRDAKKSVIL